MDSRIYIVKFKVRGVSRKLEYIVRCSTSAYAISEGLKHLVKTVSSPAIEKILIHEYDNHECELPF